MKASSDDLEHAGAGWAGLVGRLVGVGDVREVHNLTELFAELLEKR